MPENSEIISITLNDRERELLEKLFLPVAAPNLAKSLKKKWKRTRKPPIQWEYRLKDQAEFEEFLDALCIIAISANDRMKEAGLAREFALTAAKLRVMDRISRISRTPEAMTSLMMTGKIPLPGIKIDVSSKTK